MQLRRFRFFSPTSWAVLIPLLSLLVIATAQASADQAPIFSVTQISDSGEGGAPKMAVYWSGELPAQLVYGPEDDSGHFRESGNDVLEDRMTLLPAPGNPDSMVFRVLDASQGTLAEHRQETPLYGWQSEFVGPGLPWGEVSALTIFQEELIIAGRFLFADDKLVNYIARWNGSEWQALEGPQGIGLESDQFLDLWTRISALQVYQDKLVVSGPFTRAGGTAADRLAVWDGNQWTAFEDNQGARFNGGISKMTIFDGDLIVSGSFTKIDDQVVNHIARWNGSAWLPLSGPSGTGVSLAPSALTEYEGNLLAGGYFPEEDWGQVQRIVVWDGSDWSPLEGDDGEGLSQGYVRTMAVFKGDLIAGGYFKQVAGTWVGHIARWDGNQWHAMTSLDGSNPYMVGLSEPAKAMIVYEGKLIVGGDFGWADGLATPAVAAWNGESWSGFGLPGHSGHLIANALAIHDGSLIAAGDFPGLGNQMARNIARWDIDQWVPLEADHATGIHGPAQSRGLNAIVSHQNDLFVGGTFSHIGRQEANNFARWNGNEWVDIPGITGTHGFWSEAGVRTMLPHGEDLFVAGQFSHAGTVEATSIARWDGNQWHALKDADGHGLIADGVVNALTIYNDELILAGRFGISGGATFNSIARWNGQQWTPLSGSSGTGITSSNREIFALAVVGGELIVGGRFRQAGGIDVVGIARWNGDEWLSMGQDFEPMFSSVHALTEFQGQLHVSGSFRSAGDIELDRIARWSGTEWLPLENPFDNPLRGGANAMHIHQGKLVVAAPTKQGAGPIFNDIAAWDGQRWSAFTGPRRTGFTHAALEPPRALTTYNGDLYAGGEFLAAGGAPAWALSRYLKNPVQVHIEEVSPQFSDPGQSVSILVSVSGITDLSQSGIGLVSSDTGHVCTSDEITPTGNDSLTFLCEMVLEESGFHQLTAYYDLPSDPHNALSQPYMQAVKSVSSITGGVSPTGSQHAGRRIIFYGDVTGPFDPSGTVHVDVDGQAVCSTQTMSNFHCKFFVTHDIGELQVTFSYSGDDLHFPSSHSQTYTITEPLLEITPGHLDFGVVDAGVHLPTGTVTLTNRSDAEIDLTAISSAAAPFQVHPDSDCAATPFTLQPGSSCQLVYSFDPATSGEFSRWISIYSDLPGNQHYFLLTGTGRDEVLHDRFEVKPER